MTDGKQTVILDIDDVCINRRLIEFACCNEALGLSYDPRDFPGIYSMKDVFGVSRNCLNEIRARNAYRLANPPLMPGFLTAVSLLSPIVRFDLATARETPAMPYTVEFYERLMPKGTGLYFCACPRDNCDNADCQTREQKLVLAKKTGAIAMMDDHPGEFTKHDAPLDWISLVCFRQPYNADIPAFFPRLGWPGFVNHIRRLVA